MVTAAGRCEPAAAFGASQDHLPTPAPSTGPRMRHLAVPAALTATVLALTACSGGGHPKDEGAPTVRGTSVHPAPTTAAPKAGILGQAQSVTLQGYTVAATAVAYRQPLRSADGPPERGGYEYAGLDIRVCMTKTPDGKPTDVNIDPWSVAFADDTTADPQSEPEGSFTVPLYPEAGKPLGPGDCVRGWLVFEVPKGKRPARAQYAPTNTEDTVAPLRWAVS